MQAINQRKIMLPILLIAAFAAISYYLLVPESTRAPSGTFYRRKEDDNNSALYLKRVRTSNFWGNCGPVSFPIELAITEYRRITCAPGEQYTKATSDWYKPTWSQKADAFVDSYVVLSRAEGLAIWKEQAPITREVARKLAELKNARSACAAS
jgi:hypothetical protein